MRADLNVPLADGEITRRHPDQGCAADDPTAPQAGREGHPGLPPRAAREPRRALHAPGARSPLEAPERARDARARRSGRRGRRRRPPGSSRGRCSCSKTAAGRRGRPRTTPTSPQSLAGLADLYVNDAFGAAHRAHATTEGVAHRLPAYAGLLLERELSELTALRDDPERPLVVVLGGAKVSDKIGVLQRFLEIADKVLIGGAMCFSFFRARGVGTGDSLWSRTRTSPSPRRSSKRWSAPTCELASPHRPGHRRRLLSGRRAQGARRDRGA